MWVSYMPCVLATFCVYRGVLSVVLSLPVPLTFFHRMTVVGHENVTIDVTGCVTMQQP